MFWCVAIQAACSLVKPDWYEVDGSPDSVGFVPPL